MLASKIGAMLKKVRQGMSPLFAEVIRFVQYGEQTVDAENYAR